MLRAHTAGLNPIRAHTAGLNPIRAHTAGLNPIRAQTSRMDPIRAHTEGVVCSELVSPVRQMADMCDSPMCPPLTLPGVSSNLAELTSEQMAVCSVMSSLTQHKASLGSCHSASLSSHNIRNVPVTVVTSCVRTCSGHTYNVMCTNLFRPNK